MSVPATVLFSESRSLAFRVWHFSSSIQPTFENDVGQFLKSFLQLLQPTVDATAESSCPERHRSEHWFQNLCTMPFQPTNY